MKIYKNQHHPFRSIFIGQEQGYAVEIGAEDRLQRVKNFDLETCYRALELPAEDLQSTVRKAIERRIRKLEKQEEQG